VSVGDFYDGLAPKYHLVYGDDWDVAVEEQGAALDRLIRALHGGAADVLDCSCGIGTQAIGLARREYRVSGTDISGRSIERARAEASRLGARVTFGVADFRELDKVDGTFDVVISCDNALPHLLDDADLSRALAAMRSKLRPNGLLVIGIRDYDRALIERPAVAPPQVVTGPPRRLIVRLHDWDADGPFHTVHLFVLTDAVDGWTVAHHQTRYRALPRAVLARAADDAGYTDMTWHEADATGFPQPLMTARAG
jgi:SAM-dependent methyltransferase